jgi:hypothetical protein
MRGWRIEDGKTWLKEEPQMGGAGGFATKNGKERGKLELRTSNVEHRNQNPKRGAEINR